MLAKILVCALLLGLAESTIFSRCRLARVLRESGIRRSLIPDWICLAEAESRRNSSALASEQRPGHYKYGMFQISSEWCEVGKRGKRCEAKCEDLVGEDIQEHIRCATEIFYHHGFNAWESWKTKCRGKLLPDVIYCLKP